jgi:biopolymer transport protein ExbD
MPTDSFSDIAFLLIVFFILTVTMALTKGIKTTLPSGEKAEAEETALPSVAVYPGRIEYKEKEVTLDGLRQALQELKLPERKPADRMVMLEAVEEPRWESYCQVWALIVKAGGVVAMVETEGEE